MDRWKFRTQQKGEDQRKGRAKANGSRLAKEKREDGNGFQPNGQTKEGANPPDIVMTGPVRTTLGKNGRNGKTGPMNGNGRRKMMRKRSKLKKQRQG